MKSIYRAAGRAIKDFDLIHEGDRIAVGVSGGKDSLVLLKALAHFKRVAPIHFDLCAISVDLGFAGHDLSPLQAFCDELNIPFHIYKTDIGTIVFDIRKEKKPCALCSNLRRGALHTAAKELGYSTIALGHHRDDAAETLLMSMLSEGRFRCFKPKSYLSRMDVTVIRPLVYVTEDSIREAVRTEELPVIPSGCPADGNTSRQEAKDLLKVMEQSFPKARHHLLLSLSNVDENSIWHKVTKE